MPSQGDSDAEQHSTQVETGRARADYERTALWGRAVGTQGQHAAARPGLTEDLRAARAVAIASRRAHGPKLWMFESRDHGSLIQAEGRAEKAVQFEIGNPLTAESMTRHQLGAALYAPLRVLLYEDENGKSVFEYDLPSCFFSQFGDPRVTAVGLELDRQLEAILLSAAG